VSSTQFLGWRRFAVVEGIDYFLTVHHCPGLPINSDVVITVSVIPAPDKDFYPMCAPARSTALGAG